MRRWIEPAFRGFFSSGTFDAKISVNRLNNDIEAMARLRGFAETQPDMAPAQIKAPGEPEG